jgi:hypothetical protein
MDNNTKFKNKNRFRILSLEMEKKNVKQSLLHVKTPKMLYYINLAEVK